MERKIIDILICDSKDIEVELILDTPTFLKRRPEQHVGRNQRLLGTQRRVEEKHEKTTKSSRSLT